MIIEERERTFYVFLQLSQFGEPRQSEAEMGAPG
jgi:hypothetical protein